MKHKSYTAPFLLIAFLGIVAFHIKKEPDFLLKTRIFIDTYRINYSPEKIYVHHDKNQYIPGEIMWMKAYVRDATRLKETKKSGVLHVELSHESAGIVKKITLPIENGTSSGDILLPYDLVPGTYFITAYTQWARNFGNRGIFKKEVHILNTEEGLAFVNEINDADVDLQFFPESGDLIANLTQEVAFKAIDAKGRGIAIQGSIIDGQGKKITDFKDMHDGMGSFELTPEVGEAYFAQVTFPNGDVVDYPLPSVGDEGIKLRVDEVTDDSYLLVSVESTSDSAMNLLFLGMIRDVLLVTEEISVSNEKPSEFRVDKSFFPTGVANFILTDQNGEPIAERLAFIQHQTENPIQLSTDKTHYNLREEVNVLLDVKEGDPGETNQLSMVVLAEDHAAYSPYQENIKTYLLLTSDLKGTIHNPNYYFESEDETRRDALRLLMMTQGWRRFTWEELREQKLPEIKFSNEQDLNLWGRLVKSNGEPINGGEALLYLKDSYQTFVTTETNEDGYFVFQGFYFDDTITVAVQGSDRRGRRENVMVKMIDNHGGSPSTAYFVPSSLDFSPKISKDYAVAVQDQFQATESALGDMDLREVLLKEVVVKGKTEIREPFRLHREADVTLLRSQLPVAPSGNILESLQGRVAGLQIFATGPQQYRVAIRGQRSPLFLLDGIPVSRGTVQNINQFNISRVEILRGPATAAIYGGFSSGGVIALYTEMFNPDLEVSPIRGKHIITYRAPGFTKTRQFYSPKYEADNGDYQHPDLRSTIYWEPNIETKTDSSHRFNFFTADTPGTYRVVLEGISSSGNPIWRETSFTVGQEAN